MDVSTTMANNTAECENEELVLEKVSSARVKRIIVCNKCGKGYSSYPTLFRHICDVDSDGKDSGYETNEEVMTVENKKRRAYCKTKAGIETKKKCKENANVKRHILNHLSMIHGSYVTIKKLVKML